MAFHVAFNNKANIFMPGPEYPGPFSTYTEASKWATDRASKLGLPGDRYLVISEESARPTTNQSHYASMKPEPIEVVEAWGLNFYRANALKYIARAGKKDTTKEGTIKDLEKAISYLRREVNALNGQPAW